MKRQLTLVLLLAALIGGCKAPQLDQSGPYKGNVGLYVQDDAITSVNRGLVEFLKWEQLNRPLLPAKVSRYADYVRTNRFEWNQKAIRCRDAYALAPSDEKAAAFKAALLELNQALTETAILMAQPKAK